MNDERYKALVVTETRDGRFLRDVTTRSVNQLPAGDVLIRVHYSSLNYKDALSATGSKGVTKNYPHVPGVDAAGVVEHSDVAVFSPGDEVLVTGYDLGSNTGGGWGERIRVPAGWVVRRPDALTLRESMQYGTAGFTAALSVYKLLHYGIKPDQGPILVTGSTGGVGCIAVSILGKLGFHVVAVTGKKDEKAFLRALGASEIFGRDEVIDQSVKPLLSTRWNAVVDTVGGPMLETALRKTRTEGAVACCGNIGSAELHTSIYPFILRGITLFGIGSAFTPRDIRVHVWQRLASDWKVGALDELTIEASLDELNRTYIDRILRGGIRGRVLVNLGL